MNLINGKYLKNEILAFSGDEMNLWLIVFDGKYNYILFNTHNNGVIRLYKRNAMPSNMINNPKQVEFYSTFNNALENLMRVIVNNHSFKPTFLEDVFR